MTIVEPRHYDAPAESTAPIWQALMELPRFHRVAGQWIACCPAHPDRNPSLSIRLAPNGRVLLHCHAGCQTRDVVTALGFTMADLSSGDSTHQRQDERGQEASAKLYPSWDALPDTWHDGRLVAFYNYEAADRALAYAVRRYEKPALIGHKPDKDCIPFHPVARGQWAAGLPAQRVLLHLPQLISAPKDTLIYFVEGEKAANAVQEALTAAGVLGVVTTTVGGSSAAEKTPQDAFGPLAGHPVIVLPDNDDSGRKYAEKIAERARKAGAAQVITLDLDGLPDKGDFVEWQAAGHTAEELAALAAERLDAQAQAEASAAALSAWPTLDPAARYGLAGAIVRLIEPHTEADPVAILAQLLAYFGNAVGRTAYVPVEAQRHYANENVVLVGDTAKARKGTSAGWADSAYQSRDDGLEEWRSRHVLSGLTSGEGLIHVVRDHAEDDATPASALQNDKRLLILESEFGATLRIMGRDGNSLSGIVREAWDGRTLRTMGKRAPEVATDAHISIIGHVTRDELLRYLSATDSTNGFGNRFLWVCVRRSKSLPEGGALPDEALDPYRERLARAVSAARGDGLRAYPMRRDDEARQLWCEVYDDLSAGATGLFGAMTARSEAHVMRLALLYALLDQSNLIRRPHLEAALALWRYCEDSARYLFGDRLTDPNAEAILRGLLDAGDAGLTRTQISQLLGRHAKADEINCALDLLRNQGRARCEPDAPNGRTIERWHAVRNAKTAKTAKTAERPQGDTSQFSQNSHFAAFTIDAQPPIPAHQNGWASMADVGIYGDAETATGDPITPPSPCERPTNCARRTLANGSRACGICDAPHHQNSHQNGQSAPSLQPAPVTTPQNWS